MVDVPLTPNPVCSPLWQNKASVDKAKQALESEYNELQIELKTLTQGKGESEQRRKKAESLVQELQVKHGESERQRQELVDKMNKMQVQRSSGGRMSSMSSSFFSLLNTTNVFASSPSLTT